ncbi:hypothetical protein BOW53_15250 [Solemya pervernicosa gill symbiont]|uniref:GST N-terminal domain-containing protein n=1 Tax=Solemya pervernicosa gill symbiont TaxID=642797 RepID=A0A1T2L0B0_9GAMM|nr:hypothetical protein BOW53_15250 [Solemya pervernicosa gill symbiont]
MSLCVDGDVSANWLEAETERETGEFKRFDSQFRNWITPDGSVGQSGVGGFKAEAGRYHLYISHACPWAHRALIFRKLKGLESMISLSVVNPLMGDAGWSFEPYPGATDDGVYGARFLSELYTLAAPIYNGIVTVPVLWDKQRNTIVNNESSEIIRMFNSAFEAIGANDYDYYPELLRTEIDTINRAIYDHVNNGVYKVGFASADRHG